MTNHQVFNSKTTFTKDAEFLQDVYIYGTLHYDLVGFGGTFIATEDITISSQADVNNLYVTGIATFLGPVGFASDINATGISTFASMDVDNIDVGIATVRERFELTNEDGTQHLVGFASGPRAGKVGIGSTLPDQSIDVDSIRVLSNIFDSDNNQGSNGYYLSRDVNGIRWVNAVPDAQTDGFFVYNEGVLVGVGSFTAMNLIGTGSGGDLVHATANGTTVDIVFYDHWYKNASGIHTTVNVGINQVNPSVPLDVNGQSFFNDLMRIDAPVRVHGNNITGTITTAIYAHNAGVATVAYGATFAKQAGFSTLSGIATFARQAGFATVSGTATFALKAGISTFIETVETLTDQNFFIPFVENSTSTGIETVRVDSGIRYNPSKDQLTLDGPLELNSSLIDVNQSTGVGAGKTDYRLASVGSGVSWRPAGVETKNILYVTKDGDDSNSGLLEGDAKATIGGAAAVALDGDTIYVRPGTYFEDNPIGLRTDVSISGQDLRLVTVVPNNPAEDLFHVRRGCLIENMNFAGNSVSIGYSGAMVAFPPLVANQNSGYVAPGPANEGPSGRWRSPYIRNCTNFATDSVGMRVDGNLANAAFSGTNNLGQDLKSMVVDSYTQYNQNGIGVSITNKGYAQLVSIFTINSKIAIFAASGGQCDLTNSNSSFGIYGLYADGTSNDEFTGITTGAKLADVDTFEIFGVRDENSDVRKPFDGQGAFFKLDLDDYTDTGTKTGIVTEPLRTIREIKITNGGSGYNQFAPPAVTVSEPLGPEGILAELSANVSAAGTITSVDIIASGRNFLPAGSGSNQQDISISFSGNGGATAEALTDPILFTVDTSTIPISNTGLSTVTFNEFVPYNVGTGVSISFRRLSRIITSSHSFEYVGAGTDINRANPFQGGEPIPENEIVAINGGQVPFTSTDQKGNFRIGQGLVIDQTTSTISGRDFNRAIQANLTPLILALGG